MTNYEYLKNLDIDSLANYLYDIEDFEEEWFVWFRESICKPCDKNHVYDCCDGDGCPFERLKRVSLWLSQERNDEFTEFSPEEIEKLFEKEGN